MFYFKNSTNFNCDEGEKCQRTKRYWPINGTFKVSLKKLNTDFKMLLLAIRL